MKYNCLFELHCFFFSKEQIRTKSLLKISLVMCKNKSTYYICYVICFIFPY